MKEQILKLRELGFTYNEIVKKLGCSKGTISYHCGKRTGIKKSKIPKTICKCGHKKSHNAKMCHKCKINNSFEIQENRTLEDITSKGNARVKWSHLRELAKKKLEREKIKKECKICKFNIAVEVCHIKPISSFNMNTLVKEVNSLKNLVYLCPNHHTMLDKGLLNIGV